ncbi:MAG: hypothetical protein IJB05_06475 [Bacteroidales bacterium]|nr:hypothetical protein [Bacteroidales bacterium]
MNDYTMREKMHVYEKPQIEEVELVNEGTILIGSDGVGAGGGTGEDEWG